MTNPCCCSPTSGCTDQPCIPENFNKCSEDEWYAEALYNDIANAFLTNVFVDLGQVNFRLALPWKGVAFGCWDADETNTCCGQYDCDPCGGSSIDTMRMDCFSGWELTNFSDPSWRASIYRPNQFLTNCQGCSPPPNNIGYLTYGLPTIDQYWPRCNDCASRTPSECKFYQELMPDYYVVDPNFGMVYAAGAGGVIQQPAENGLPCCDEPPYEQPCPSPPGFPYRESLRFEDPPAPGVFRLLTIPGSPTPCEPAAYRDVYVRKDLWIMPNLVEGASGNCIRLLFRLQYQHTFLPIVPGVTGPGQPAPCSCVEVGRCYVLPEGDCSSRLAQSEGWYYMDIYGTDTLATVLNRPLRLFRVLHSGAAEPITCGVEEQVVLPLLPGFTGCECVVPPPPAEKYCQDVATTACPNPPPYTDCQTFPTGLAEVPCSPPNSGLFPVPPQNAHFDFPTRLWITI